MAGETRGLVILLAIPSGDLFGVQPEEFMRKGRRTRDPSAISVRDERRPVVNGLATSRALHSKRQLTPALTTSTRSDELTKVDPATVPTVVTVVDPKSIWSYSSFADQFGAKPHSTLSPITRPLRSALEEVVSSSMRLTVNQADFEPARR